MVWGEILHWRKRKFIFIVANAFSQFQVAGVLPQSHAIRAGKTTLTMRHAQPQKLNPKNLLQNTLAKNSNL